MGSSHEDSSKIWLANGLAELVVGPTSVPPAPLDAASAEAGFGLATWLRRVNLCRRHRCSSNYELRAGSQRLPRPERIQEEDVCHKRHVAGLRPYSAQKRYVSDIEHRRMAVYLHSSCAPYVMRRMCVTARRSEAMLWLRLAQLALPAEEDCVVRAHNLQPYLPWLGRASHSCRSRVSQGY